MIKQAIFCDGSDCKRPIINESKNPLDISGYTVVGNIHVVHTEEDEGIGGGLVGNNLEEGRHVARVAHYCPSCMLRLLRFKEADLWDAYDEASKPTKAPEWPRV